MRLLLSIAISIVIALCIAAVDRPFDAVARGSGTPFFVAGASTSAACPQGTAFVGSGDGCQNAQSGGTRQVANFFTGYTGTSYGTRPGWNVAGVDYPVGYQGALSAPVGSIPAGCSSSISGRVVTIAGNCTVSHIDFTNPSPYCISVSATGGTVTFDNDKFGVDNTDCGSTGIIRLTGSSSVVVQYSTLQDGETYQGQGFIFGNPSATVQYCDLIGLSARLINVNAGATGSYVSQYNYLEDIGSPAGSHAEIIELNTSATVALEQDSWNVFYATGNSNGSTTSFDYITSGAPTVGTVTQGTVSFNVEVSRPKIVGGGVTVPVPTRIDTSFSNTISNLLISNNWYDPTGGFTLGLNNSIFLATGAGGAITTASCVTNKFWNGSAWASIAGSQGSAGQTFTCS